MTRIWGRHEKERFDYSIEMMTRVHLWSYINLDEFNALVPSLSQS